MAFASDRKLITGRSSSGVRPQVAFLALWVVRVCVVINQAQCVLEGRCAGTPRWDFVSHQHCEWIALLFADGMHDVIRTVTYVQCTSVSGRQPKLQAPAARPAHEKIK